MSKPHFDHLHGTTAGEFSVGSGRPADASAVLDASSTSKGFLPPRMTAAQRIAIVAPTDGLVVYDTTAATLYLRADGIWVPLNREVYVPADNTALSMGYFGYISSNDTVSKTDATNMVSSRCLGVHPGMPGVMQIAGLITNAVFSQTCPTPIAGRSVFLARLDDEPLGDASGKLTPVSPSTGVVAEVGLVLHVEPDFPTTRVADVVLSLKSVAKRAN